jgi:hypothetical protein
MGLFRIGQGPIDIEDDGFAHALSSRAGAGRNGLRRTMVSSLRVVSGQCATV